MKSTRKTMAVRVAVGVLESEERFLVARRPLGLHQGGKWEFPGGKVHPGETPRQCVSREVLEETGMEFQDASLLHVQEYSYPELTVELHFFLCTGPQEAASPAAGRVGELRWVPLEELVRLEMPPANQVLLEILSSRFGPSGSSGSRSAPEPPGRPGGSS